MNSCDHQCGSCAQACSERTEPRESLKAPLAPGSRVGKVIGVVSGKGGVGKSLITGLLASKMQARGAHAAVMDADITGPSIPRLFGMTGRLMGDEEGFLAESLDEVTEVEELVLALHILGGAYECFSHNNSPFSDDF